MTMRVRADVAAELEKRLVRGITLGTELVRNEAIDQITGTPKTGKLYRRGGKLHRASAPGEPYATDTGVTIGKIVTDTDVEPSRVVGRIIFAGENARRLELGTEKMAPRSVARPALENSRSKVHAIVRKTLKGSGL